MDKMSLSGESYGIALQCVAPILVSLLEMDHIDVCLEDSIQGPARHDYTSNTRNTPPCDDAPLARVDAHGNGFENACHLSSDTC